MEINIEGNAFASSMMQFLFCYLLCRCFYCCCCHRRHCFYSAAIFVVDGNNGDSNRYKSETKKETHERICSLHRVRVPLFPSLSRKKHQKALNKKSKQ